MNDCEYSLLPQIGLHCFRLYSMILSVAGDISITIQSVSSNGPYFAEHNQPLSVSLCLCLINILCPHNLYYVNEYVCYVVFLYDIYKLYVLCSSKQTKCIIFYMSYGI